MLEAQDGFLTATVGPHSGLEMYCASPKPLTPKVAGSIPNPEGFEAASPGRRKKALPLELSRGASRAGSTASRPAFSRGSPLSSPRHGMGAGAEGGYSSGLEDVDELGPGSPLGRPRHGSPPEARRERELERDTARRRATAQREEEALHPGNGEGSGASV
jgi:hypothetical protein